MKRWLQVLFLLLVALAALRYWAAAAWRRPADPLSVIALCRAGDIEYYPMLAALARFELGEAMVYEKAGTGIVSFPVVSLAPHVLCVRLFGAYGYLVADVLVYLAYYGCLLLFFKAALVQAPWRQALSLFLVAGGFEFQYWLPRLLPAGVSQFAEENDLTFRVWGERLPRPYVSELLLLLGLAAVLWIVRSGRGRTRYRTWVLLGVFLAGLLQGDLHGAIILCLVLVPVGLYALWRGPEGWRRTVGKQLTFAGSFVTCSGLFIAQRLGEVPDVSARLGVFPVGRLDPRFWDVSAWQRLAPIGLLVLAAVGALAWLGRRVDRGVRTRLVLVLFLACVVACFALPLSALALGRTVQPYQFTDRLARVRTYTALVAGACLIGVLGRALAGRRATWAGRAAVAAAASWAVAWLVLGVAVSTHSGDRWAVHRDERLHMRYRTIPEWAALPNYRNEFAALAVELASPRYDGCKVLGTFDLQVFAWWTTFRDGYTFLPETFLTTVPDAEIEGRLNCFCKLLGLDAGQFRELLRRRYVTVFWLGCNKYQASRAHTFAPLDDYPPAVRQHIAEHTTVYSNWYLAIPQGEEDRLVRAYEALGRPPESPPRLDVVVLIKGLEDFSPPAGQFAISFENATFRVWLRRPGAAAPQESPSFP